MYSKKKIRLYSVLRLLPDIMSLDDLRESFETGTESDLTQDAILQPQTKDLQKQINELNTHITFLCKNKIFLFKAVLDFLNPAANSLVSNFNLFEMYYSYGGFKCLN